MEFAAERRPHCLDDDRSCSIKWMGKRVVWLADAPAASDEQLGDDDDAEVSEGKNLQIDRAVALLCRLLPIGARRPAPEIKREMAAQGFSKGTIGNAAKALGVTSEESPGRPSIWSR
jgi:hypothetical protein